MGDRHRGTLHHSLHIFCIHNDLHYIIHKLFLHKGFLKNERENTLLGVIEESRKNVSVCVCVYSIVCVCVCVC